MGFIGLLGAGLALWQALKKKQQATPNLTTANYANTTVLEAMDRERRKAMNRMNRQATRITGGLNDVPTLGSAAMWGL